MSYVVTNDNPEPESLRPFGIMWSGQAVSLFGSRIVRFALVWWITDLTGSATMLAIGTIMALLPQVFIAPFAGSYVDRWNRRRTMIAADALIAVSIMCLAYLFFIGIANIWYVFLIMFVGSAFGAFHWPAMQASTTLMVPKKHLARTGGLNQSLNGFSTIIAPPIGAVLYVLLPMQSILLVDVFSAMIAIIAVASIAIPQPARALAVEETSVLRDMKEGFTYLKDWRGGFLLMFFAMALNLLAAPAMSLSPILVKNYFLGTELDLALMQSVGAMGMLIGAVLLTAWGGTEKKIVTALGALVFEGVALAAIGFVPADSFYVAIAFYTIVNFLNPIVNGALIAIFQATIPPEKQGRVLALLVAGASAMSPIGLAVAGPIADVTGVSFWFILSGVVTTILSFIAFFVPSLMNIEEKPLEQDTDTRELGTERYIDDEYIKEEQIIEDR